MSAKTISVVINVIDDDETGEEIIIPSQREMDEDAFRWKTSLETAMEEKNESRIETCKSSLKLIEKRRAMYDELLKKAEKREYKIKKPTYGDLFEAYGDCEVERNGAYITDNRLLMKTMLKLCLDGMDEKAIEDLSPSIAYYLWNKINSIITPDPNKLPFLLQRS